MNNSVKRYLILLAGVIANLCQGVAYTSSVFMLPLGEALARPPHLWSREWGIIFAMTLAFLPVGMLLSGKLADLGYTRLTAGIGALLFGGGLLLASLGGSVFWIAATLGVMTSIGSGCAYGTIVAAVVRWFPDRRGLASGIAVAAVGLGPTILAPLAGWIMNSGYDVLAMFRILGVICLVAMGLAAACIVNPPPGYAPEGWRPPQPATGPAKAPEGLVWTAMIRRPLFWLLFVTYFCGVFAGILVNGMAKPIAIELANLDSAQATRAVMLFALCSAGGRVLWGFLSDKFGRLLMVGAAFVLTAAAMFILYGHVATPGMFMPCVAVAGLCYGGVFGTFPSLCADSFGVKNAAVNLAVLFTSFSLVAIIAPQVVALYRNAGPAEYPKAFLVAGCVAVAGTILSIIMGRTMKTRG